MFSPDFEYVARFFCFVENIQHSRTRLQRIADTTNYRIQRTYRLDEIIHYLYEQLRFLSITYSVIFQRPGMKNIFTILSHILQGFVRPGLLTSLGPVDFDITLFDLLYTTFLYLSILLIFSTLKTFKFFHSINSKFFLIMKISTPSLNSRRKPFVRSIRLAFF